MKVETRIIRRRLAIVTTPLCKPITVKKPLTKKIQSEIKNRPTNDTPLRGVVEDTSAIIKNRLVALRYKLALFLSTTIL
jgi:hypothetical protein